MHILEGRLINEPEVAGEPLAPGWIKERALHIPGSRFQVQLPARRVTVVEVPLNSAGSHKHTKISDWIPKFN